MNAADMQSLVRLGRIALKSASEATHPRDMINYWALLARADSFATSMEEKEKYEAEQAKAQAAIDATAKARAIEEAKVEGPRDPVVGDVVSTTGPAK